MKELKPLQDAITILNKYAAAYVGNAKKMDEGKWKDLYTSLGADCAVVSVELNSIIERILSDRF